jgi:hypothetical protein
MFLQTVMTDYVRNMLKQMLITHGLCLLWIRSYYLIKLVMCTKQNLVNVETFQLKECRTVQ